MKLKMLEKDVKKAITDFLDLQKCIYWSNTAIFGRTNKAGIPDYTVLLRYGRTLLIEIKRPGGKLSKAQKRFQANCIEIGHTYIMADDVNTVIREFEIVWEEEKKRMIHEQST